MSQLLDGVVDWIPVSDHGGNSGGRLTWGVLADGSRLMVKRFELDSDLTMQITRDTDGRQAALWVSGVLDRLPEGTGHGILDAWREGPEWVLVMEDLSSGLVSDDAAIDEAQLERVIGAVAAVHDAYRGVHVDGLAALSDYVSMLSPQTMAPRVGGEHPLPSLIIEGWERFHDLAPDDVAAAVDAVHADPHAFAEELLDRSEPTLLHGDVWLNNLALMEDRVILFDWALAVRGPAALDAAFFLAGNASRIPVSREEYLERVSRREGDLVTPPSTALSLMSGLALMGWNKALDATTAPDPALRERERADLDWWVQRGRDCLESAWSPG